ncbi:MAG: ABC transporter substrate-binding protein [Firmicutes bacterium]|nr:ABC transporter substrate-binding protein [Bacillota bacterium]
MKKFTLLLVVFVFGFALSACQSEAETVKFGVIGPLTGDYSFYGTSVENGANLAAAEINADGGVLGLDLEIIAYDSKGEVVDGVNAYNRLIQEDEVDAIIGGTFSGVTLAFKDLAVADGVPVLSPTATNPNVTLDAGNMFRACYTDSYQGTVAALFTIEDLDATKAAVYYNIDDAYSEGLALAFIAAYEDAELTVDDYTFGSGTDDYSATLTTIKNGDYDVVFVPAYVAEVGAILTQADSLDFGDTVFVGGDGWDGIEANYAAVAEGYYFGNHYAKTDPAQNVQDFVTNYEATYGEAPSALAALAYDAVYAMALAMENAGTTDYADVVAALQALEYADAVTGAIKFDANGDPVKAITIIQVVSGEHVVIKKVQGE